jgi:threonylcarbamoyladenosine tRNA methylthiotransferase MtaB
VQDGCDYNCSFCTIPLARGASRSQTVEASLLQARTLVTQGFKEITLTGVNVGDYGENSDANLFRLLRELVKVDGLERIRISSIEPNLLTQEIIEFVASEPKMCNHFHIPLQSGCDEILRLMRRRYTTHLYADLITRITQAIPECGIGVDVIVGFPGETEERFDTTLRFVESIRASYLHVFTYSERPNTPAAAFSGKLEPKIRFKRNEILRAIGVKKKHDFYRNHIGRTVKVPAASVKPNEIVPVDISGIRYDKCVGTVARTKVAA